MKLKEEKENVIYIVLRTISILNYRTKIINNQQDLINN